MKSFFSRALWLLLLLLVVFAATHSLVRALPGDPLTTVLAETGLTTPPEILRKELGLDRPFLLALKDDLWGVLKGDLGNSLQSHEPIAPLLAKCFRNTFVLTLAALLMALPFSLFLGLKAAAQPKGWADHVCTYYGALVAALPTPWIGPVLLIVLAVWIPVFSVGDSLPLPALTLALSFSGLWARLIRERVTESLRVGSARGARARGIPEWQVLIKYGLAPVSGPLLAYLGTQLGALLSGAFVTEVIFQWEGMGTLMIQAILRRDYPVVQAAAFITAAACLAGNALGDLFQNRFEKGGVQK